MKRNRKFVDGQTITNEVGPSALRRLREARQKGLVSYKTRKSPEGTFQYKIS